MYILMHLNDDDDDDDDTGKCITGCTLLAWKQGESTGSPINPEAAPVRTAGLCQHDLTGSLTSRNGLSTSHHHFFITNMIQAIPYVLSAIAWSLPRQTDRQTDVHGKEGVTLLLHQPSICYEQLPTKKKCLVHLPTEKKRFTTCDSRICTSHEGETNT